MEKRKANLNREELVAMLQTQGWDLVTGSQAVPLKNKTLEEAARAAHARQAKGEEPGLIAKIEDTLELDMVQLQQIWEYLGLPI